MSKRIKPQCFNWTYTEGDTLPDIVGVLEDVDLTGSTVTLHIDRDGYGTDNVEKTATLLDAANGHFRFGFDSSDLTCGDLVSYISVEKPGGELISYPRFVIKVLPKVEAP